MKGCQAWRFTNSLDSAENSGSLEIHSWELFGWIEFDDRQDIGYAKTLLKQLESKPTNCTTAI